MKVHTELRVGIPVTSAGLAKWANTLPADARISGRSNAFGGVILRATWELSTPEPESATDALAEVFKAAWHAADDRGEIGSRTTAGIAAVLAKLEQADPR